MTLWPHKYKQEMVNKISLKDVDEPLQKDVEMDSTFNEINENIESSDED